MQNDFENKIEFQNPEIQKENRGQIPKSIALLIINALIIVIGVAFIVSFTSGYYDSGLLVMFGISCIIITLIIFNLLFFAVGKIKEKKEEGVLNIQEDKLTTDEKIIKYSGIILLIQSIFPDVFYLMINIFSPTFVLSIIIGLLATLKYKPIAGNAFLKILIIFFIIAIIIWKITFVALIKWLHY